jgi:hypothetical protein
MHFSVEGSFDNKNSLIGISSTEVKIHEIESIAEVKDFIERQKFDPSATLIFFDIDQTLFTYNDAVLQRFVNPLIVSLVKSGKITKEEIPKFMSTILTQASYILTEEEDRLMTALNFLTRRFNVFGLTTTRTGKFGKIKNAEEWKNSILKDFGIIFSNEIAIKYDDTVFLNLDRIESEQEAEEIKKTKINYQILKDGVLYTGKNCTKNAFLKEFLKLPGLKGFSNIIFVDDKLLNIQNMINAFSNEEDINIEAFHYNYTRKKLNENVKDKQIEILVSEDKWISDEEALALLEIDTRIN